MFAILSKIDAAKTITLESAYNLINKIETQIQNWGWKFNTTESDSEKENDYINK